MKDANPRSMGILVICLFLLAVVLGGVLLFNSDEPAPEQQAAQSNEPAAPQKAAQTSAPQQKAAQPSTSSDNVSPIAIAKANLAKANEEVVRTSRELEEAKRVFENESNRAAGLKKTADEKSEYSQNLLHKTTQELDDPAKAPETAKARKDAREAEADAQRAKDRYDKAADANTEANENVEKAKAALGEALNPPPGVFANITSMLPALLGIALLGFLFWWTWRIIKIGNKRIIKTGDDRVEGLLRTLTKTQDSKFQELNVALSSLNGIDGKLTKVLANIEHLKKQVAEAEHLARLMNERQSENYYPPGTHVSGETPIEEPIEDAVDFPLTVNSLLSRLSGQQQIIKLDPLKGILVKDSDGKGHFLLARDRSIPGGQLYVFPRTARFQVSEDYYNHYEKFYECQNPIAGEVWVAEPAVVERVDGGWRLRDKGILEIK